MTTAEKPAKLLQGVNEAEAGHKIGEKRVFKVERVLTDYEIETLRKVALAFIEDHSIDKLAVEHGINADPNRFPLFTIENVLRATDDPNVHLWPNIVRAVLNSNGWQYGYGCIGEAS